MRILLVGSYPLDHGTSMPRYVETIQRHLVARGHAVETIFPTPLFGHLSKRQVVAKWLGYVDKFLLFPGQLFRRARQFDLVHVCDHSSSMYLSLVRGVPASITCHDLLAVASALGLYPEQRISLTGKILQRWIRSNMSRARFVVCVSHATREMLERLAPNRARLTRVIPNPLSFRYAPAPADAVAAMRKQLGLSDGESYLFHIGGNQWYKNRLGVLRIYDAFRTVLRDSGRAVPHLVLAGRPMTGAIRELAARLNRDGKIVHEVVAPRDAEVAALYTGAAALLFPSLYEGFGWPLVEAQSCGCPVISSGRAPMTEVAGVAALFIDPADEAAAGRIVAENLGNLPDLREAGFSNALRFSEETIMPQYEFFFETLLEAFKTAHEPSRLGSEAPL